MCQDVTLSTQDFSSTPGVPDRDLAGVIADQLIAQLGADRFDLWFSNRDCIQLSESNNVTVFAENKFSLNRIQSTFGTEIRSVVDRVGGPHFRIKFQTQAESET